MLAFGLIWLSYLRARGRGQTVEAFMLEVRPDKALHIAVIAGLIH
jgi:hypothetical protein